MSAHSGHYVFGARLVPGDYVETAASCDGHAGVSCEDIAKFRQLPESARFVFDTPRLHEHLCIHCMEMKNIEITDNRCSRAFCQSCLIKLHNLPEFGCGCGRPLFIDSCAQPSRLCKVCHYYEQKGRRSRRRSKRSKVNKK